MSVARTISMTRLRNSLQQKSLTISIIYNHHYLPLHYHPYNYNHPCQVSSTTSIIVYTPTNILPIYYDPHYVHSFAKSSALLCHCLLSSILRSARVFLCISFQRIFNAAHCVWLIQHVLWQSNYVQNPQCHSRKDFIRQDVYFSTTMHCRFQSFLVYEIAEFFSSDGSFIIILILTLVHISPKETFEYYRQLVFEVT